MKNININRLAEEYRELIFEQEAFEYADTEAAKLESDFWWSNMEQNYGSRVRQAVWYELYGI